MLHGNYLNSACSLDDEKPILREPFKNDCLNFRLLILFVIDLSWPLSMFSPAASNLFTR